MEMNFLHFGGQPEPGPSRPRPSYKDNRVWRDIEAETGFASCADYMEYYQDIRPDFKARLQQYRKMPEDLDKLEMRMSIYDLSEQEDSAKCLRFRQNCHSGTELIRNLRDPPGNVCVQIVTWRRRLLVPLSQEMADAVILGLKQDPQLLEDLDRLWKDEENYPTTGFRTSHITRLVGHGTIAFLSRKFISKATKATPVLLIAAHHSYFSDSTEIFDGEAFTGAGQRKPPFFRSRTDFRSLYAKAVEQFIQESRSNISTEAVLLLAAVSPLLHIEAHQIREASIIVRRTYDRLMASKLDHRSHPIMRDEDLTGDLDIQRLVLRHTLEKGEDHVKQVFRYLGSEIDTDWSMEPSYVSIEADWKSLIETARRLETEVRDYMQIQVGNLSLEESRRSIELSSIQIRESQSGQS